jgi:hypothetical protein
VQSRKRECSQEVLRPREEERRKHEGQMLEVLRTKAQDEELQKRTALRGLRSEGARLTRWRVRNTRASGWQKVKEGGKEGSEKASTEEVHAKGPTSEHRSSIQLNAPQLHGARPPTKAYPRTVDILCSYRGWPKRRAQTLCWTSWLLEDAVGLSNIFHRSRPNMVSRCLPWSMRRQLGNLRWNTTRGSV